MLMDSHNPIVKQSTLKTLDSIINTLTFLATSLDKFSEELEDSDDEFLLDSSNIRGLGNIIHCVKEATETCYMQYSMEIKQTSE